MEEEETERCGKETLLGRERKGGVSVPVCLSVRNVLCKMEGTQGAYSMPVSREEFVFVSLEEHLTCTTHEMMTRSIRGLVILPSAW
ncbi:hypothetical protein SLA2020_457670 [Shorea laevis]